MSSIILPGRWTNQPQGAVRLKSWVPPPTFFLIPTANGSFYDAATGGLIDTAGNTVVCQAGSGYSQTTNLTVLFADYPAADVDVAPVSVIYQVEHRPWVANITVSPTNNTYRPSALTSSSSGLIHSLGGGNTTVSDVMTTDLGVFTVAARVTDAAGQRAFCQGRLKQDQNRITYWNATTQASVYRATYANEMPLSLLAFWRDYDIGDELCEQASRAPWSLVEDRRRILYFDVASGGATIVSTTQAGSWSVRNTVSTTQVGAFSVRNLVATTQPATWSVRNGVTTDQAGAWSVRNLVATTQAGAWSVEQDAAIVSTTQAGGWSVRNLIGTTQAGAFSVRNLVSATQSGAWSVQEAGVVATTQAGGWSVRNLVATTQPGAWAVRNLVSASQAGAWSVLGDLSLLTRHTGAASLTRHTGAASLTRHTGTASLTRHS